jgi:tetratricopeptide (TPR) repeat protein
MVEDLLGRRRPSLAHRAQAARLEGAGDVMFRAGYFSRAAERYQQTLSQTPDNDEAQFKRGAALIATGHYGEALRVLRDALRDRPDWPFVAHDLLSLFPDEASVAKLLENLDREARRPDADGDPLFLRAYILYFTGQRDAAAAIFRNPPGGVAPAHYQVFQQALERARNGQ